MGDEEAHTGGQHRQVQGIIERIIADSQTHKGAKLPGIIYVQQTVAQEALANG